MSILGKAKAIFFFFFMVVLVALYVTNMMNVANNPAYLMTPKSNLNGTP